MADEVAARAAAALTRLIGTDARIGIALSGGGDSMALLHLAAAWGGARLQAATIDHGLRPDSAQEAAAAGRVAAALGVPHVALHWQDRGTGNLMEAAREARLRLLGCWARDTGLDAVLLGHTRDDVAETLLMRLNRGAGLDGLAMMAERREVDGTAFLRPLLKLGRDELRDWLRARGIGWTDDPTNTDMRFDRARIRAAIAAAGLDPARLADSARHLSRARDTMRDLALRAAADAEVLRGTVRLPDLSTQPRELRRVLLLAAVRCVTGLALAPRHMAVATAMDAVANGHRATLGGAIVTPKWHVLREPAAAARAAPLRNDGIWDRRWRIEGLPPGCEIRALGPAPDRPAGMSAIEAAASPGIWHGGRVIGAPLLKSMPGLLLDAIPDLQTLKMAISGG